MNTFYVTYISHSGSDEKIAAIGAKPNSNKDTETILSDLVKEGIKEPFLISQITLCETVPLYLATERFKHKVGFTYVNKSTQENDIVYTPSKWIEAVSEGDIRCGGLSLPIDKQLLINSLYEESTSKAVATYKKLLDEGVHPEQAQMVLPQSLSISYYVSGSIYSFAKAYNYLGTSNVTKDLQLLAHKEHLTIKELFPLAWNALINNLKN